MLISEIFHSIQGEGELTGVPSVFIRSSGCNLRCSWCDTPYASWNPEGEQKSIEQIVAAVNTFPEARHVVKPEPWLAAWKRDIPRHKVLLMPEGTTIEKIRQRASWLGELCKARGYRYAHRLHIELYGNKRGT